MAQRSGKRQPVYSADTLALRYIGGLMLIALGVMTFLAVEMRMAGNVFDALRQISYGLTGGLAVILPVLPIWAGVLVIWSSQRRAPVKPFLYAVLAYLGVCAFVVTVVEKKPISLARSNRSLTVRSPSRQRNGSPPSKSTNRDPIL